MQLLEFDFKRLRAEAIRDYLTMYGPAPDVICCTCGNSAKALRDVGLYVVEIGSGPNALLRPTRWLTPADIRALWPGMFDATSGHLPLPLYVEIVDRLRRECSHWSSAGAVIVPSGSGESAMLTKFAFPDLHVTARFDDNDPATTYEGENWCYTTFPALGIKTERLYSIRDNETFK